MKQEEKVPSAESATHQTGLACSSSKDEDLKYKEFVYCTPPKTVWQ